MKRIKYFSIIAAVFLIFTAASCNYLDKDPENSVPEKNVDFTNIDNLYQPVSGVYAKLRTGNMASFYRTRL